MQVTLQLFLFLFLLQHMKRPALQNKQVTGLRIAFRDFRETGPWAVVYEVLKMASRYHRQPKHIIRMLSQRNE
mgnify:CR=1 FL=1